MPLKIVRWVVRISSVTLAFGFGARAQSAAPCTTIVALGAISYEAYKSGAPYTATVTETHEQRLPDGSVVRGSAITHQARDSAGKTFEERSMGCQPGPDGQRHPVVRVLVSDPASGTTISWTVDDPAKVLRVVHGPARVSRPPEKTDERQEAAGHRALAQMGVQEEDLGSKSIAGAVAQGTRTVNAATARRAGSNPLKIVDETWVAKDLDLAVLRINDNSATGKTTTEVVELKLGESDASLFAPPAGYKVEEQGVKPAGSATNQ
jgi:hypothetical protein